MVVHKKNWYNIISVLIIIDRAGMECMMTLIVVAAEMVITLRRCSAKFLYPNNCILLGSSADHDRPGLYRLTTTYAI